MADPISTSAGVAGAFAYWGEILIAGFLAAVGWALKTFAGRHFEKMDTLTEKVSTINGGLRELSGKLNAISSRLDDHDERFDKVEHHLDRVDDTLGRLRERK